MGDKKQVVEQVTVAEAFSKDASTIQVLGKQTFVETFAESNTEEDMNTYLEEYFSDRKIRSELDTSGSFFFIARESGKPVGYLKLNTGVAQTELKDAHALEIERIYVLQEFQGKKVGQALYEKAVQAARRINAHYIWLGVWEENRKAIRFYEKNGFVPFGKHIFRLGNDEQTDIMMKKTLVPHY